MARAAVLYLTPSSGQFSPGQTFVVGVGLDPESECVNAAQVDISFPKDIFKVVDFGRGQSIITYWVQAPAGDEIAFANNSGSISFGGGMPGGWCGRIRGDSQGSSLLANIIFKVLDAPPSRQNVKIKLLNTSQVLLNDGRGTKANLAFQDAQLEISGLAGNQNDEWAKIVGSDKTPPEQFDINLQKDPLVFDGKYFIAFFTTDKQTGVDHYEISESPANGNALNWKIGQSPYLLEDQGLHSTIKVKAVDKAGNETAGRLVFSRPQKIKPEFLIYIFGIIGVVLAAAAFVARKIRKKPAKNE